MSAPPNVVFRPEDLSAAERDALKKLGDSVGVALENLLVEDALVGFFQTFRPDGRGLTGVFEELACGPEMHSRLEALFAVSGDDRRPSGGRDAYFIVRNPAVIEPQQVQAAGDDWIEQMRAIANALGHDQAAAKLAQVGPVRVLEGIPPKHPKETWERCDLLELLQKEIPRWVSEAVPDRTFAAILRPAYYYVNCDAMLRDYLMWPVYREHVGLADPFASYFCLWEHGVKWRVYQDTQVDLYMPRQ